MKDKIIEIINQRIKEYEVRKNHFQVSIQIELLERLKEDINKLEIELPKDKKCGCPGGVIEHILDCKA